ncbi:MAG TPA: ArsR family transcriptional regulator, partial [Thermodesulfobacteriota bacterium]|nr:ArsR family transcriptional regulator [Thermodesulfobacteriota bacterium]
MDARQALPPGTKLEILKRLVKQELSAYSLAESLGVSPTAVRQHLDTLLALGLVTRRKVVTRPSRPTYLYRLSPEARLAFPKRYDLLLTLVLDVLVEHHGRRGMEAVVEAAAHRLADEVRGRLRQPEGPVPWEAAVERLEAELAWQADVEDEPGGGRAITVYQCPFQAVAQAHAGVCALFVTTLLRALRAGAPVEAQEMDGTPACCRFRVAP